MTSQSALAENGWAMWNSAQADSACSRITSAPRRHGPDRNIIPARMQCAQAFAFCCSGSCGPTVVGPQQPVHGRAAERGALIVERHELRRNPVAVVLIVEPLTETTLVVPGSTKLTGQVG